MYKIWIDPAQFISKFDETYKSLNNYFIKFGVDLFQKKYRMIRFNPPFLILRESNYENEVAVIKVNISFNKAY